MSSFDGTCEKTKNYRASYSIRSDYLILMSRSVAQGYSQALNIGSYVIRDLIIIKFTL